MRLRPPLKTFGGKHYLAPWVVSLMPDDVAARWYVEPFAGGASVLLEKPRGPRELLADAHGPTANVLHCLATDPGGVIHGLERIKYTPASFAKSVGSSFSLAQWGNTAAAAVEIVRRRMSRGGLGKDFAWSDRTRGGKPGDVNGWQTFKAQLPAIAARLKGVGVLWSDAFTVLTETVNRPDALVYLDPPYLLGTRTAADGTYWTELTEADHERLLHLAVAHVGKVLISCYTSPLYRSVLGKWNWHSREVPNHSGQGATKQRRTEWVVTNY